MKSQCRLSSDVNVNTVKIKMKHTVLWKKYLPPYQFLWFLLLCHTYMFQTIKQILISYKDNLRKYKMPFLNDDFI